MNGDSNIQWLQPICIHLGHLKITLNIEHQFWFEKMEKGKEYLKGANKTTAKRLKVKKVFTPKEAERARSSSATNFSWHQIQIQKYKCNEGEGTHSSSALNFSRDKIFFLLGTRWKNAKNILQKDAREIWQNTLEKFDKLNTKLPLLVPPKPVKKFSLWNLCSMRQR